MVEIKRISDAQAQHIQELADSIWRQHYTPIIGVEQINYMLDKFQSRQAICSQMAEGIDYYLVTYQGHSAGYMALKPTMNSLFISKFYLDIGYRGRGIARHMLKRVNQIALSKKLSALELTVNKFNPAYQIYLKLGFENVESLQMDIGNGFIMDDYRMVKNLSHQDK